MSLVRLACKAVHALNKHIMLAGASYRRAEWLPVEEVRTQRAQLLRNFLCRAPEPGDGVDPEWLRIERVIAQSARTAGQQFLVKARARTHTVYARFITDNPNGELAQKLSHASHQEV